MQFYISALFLFLLPSALSVPVAEPLPEVSPLGSPLFDRGVASTELITRDAAKDPAPKKAKKEKDCQKPIAQNLCNSGSPYCCSGTGDQQVCGPAGTVTCESMTICCINTNGVSLDPIQ